MITRSTSAAALGATTPGYVSSGCDWWDLQEDKRLCRLVPVEFERLTGFPDGWTEGLPDTRRAFMMGNALVVGVVQRIGKVLRAT